MKKAVPRNFCHFSGNIQINGFVSRHPGRCRTGSPVRRDGILHAFSHAAKTSQGREEGGLSKNSPV
ncbi:hypothetical protein C3920_01125 [Novacetimonas pomaceti]|uniref:Uncharacterized protein n=1 Tax=Novacetimonas pomaceti TaxID=2021998 RepID=A0ABX5P8N2_9PROT|nr:hypothetical protein C3920_01125 [Novacetimonas pomaceti]